MFPPPSRTPLDVSADPRCPACHMLLEFPIWSCDRCSTRFHGGCVRERNESGCSACATGARPERDLRAAVVSALVLFALLVAARWISF